MQSLSKPYRENDLVRKNVNRWMEIIVTFHATAKSCISPKTKEAAACQLCHW